MDILFWEEDLFLTKTSSVSTIVKRQDTIEKTANISKIKDHRTLILAIQHHTEISI